MLTYFRKYQAALCSFAALLTTGLSPAFCKPEANIKQRQVKPLSQLNLEANFPDLSARLLGFTPNNDAVLVVSTDDGYNSGAIVRWNVIENRANNQIPLSKWLSAFSIVMSANGRQLMTDNSHTDPSFPNAQGYRITCLNSMNFQIQWAKPIRSNQNSGGFLPIVGDEKHIVAQIQVLFPYKGEIYFGDTHFEFFNLSTGKVDKNLAYEHADGATGITLSPSGKYLACSFTKGEDDTLDGRLDRQGIVDILDPKTGKILWHLQGTAKQPVGDPFFFISPTRFISSDTLFDIRTRKARPWNAITPTRKCLAVVPNHPNYALFLTPQGLQLRNWQKDKLLMSWPTLKQSGRILFSPDLKMFSFKRGSLVQFWKFDPQWLR